MTSLLELLCCEEQGNRRLNSISPCSACTAPQQPFTVHCKLRNHTDELSYHRNILISFTITHSLSPLQPFCFWAIVSFFFDEMQAARACSPSPGGIFLPPVLNFSLLFLIPTTLFVLMSFQRSLSFLNGCQIWLRPPDSETSNATFVSIAST